LIGDELRSNPIRESVLNNITRSYCRWTKENPWARLNDNDREEMKQMFLKLIDEKLFL
jgi:hypothetical protein